MESNDAFDWATPSGEAITVQELEVLITDYKEKRGIYEEAKKVSGERYADYQVAENKVTEALKLLGKKSYKVEGLGTFTRTMKEVVKVPKDIEDKRKLFEWIAERYGPDVLDDMRSINHQKLNSFYNQEVEKEQDNPAFSIPGIDAPTSVEGVSFRKA